MEELKIIEQHELIRKTIGYSLISKLDTVDIPPVLSFLRIVDNYLKMKNNYDGRRAS